MANKDFIVVFNDQGVRIIYGDGTGAIGANDKTISNPDLSAVRGIPPHQWKLVNGAVVNGALIPAVPSKQSFFKRLKSFFKRR